MPWRITDIIVGKNSGGFYSFFLDTEDKIIHSYSIRPLATEEVEHYRDRYYDGTVYISRLKMNMNPYVS